MNQITIGMNTHEASLVGGAYFYRVIADEDVWDKDTDQNIIIKTQVIKPDNSQIWMTFQNTTQYPDKGLQTFQVEFQKGKVVDIKNITKDTSC
ncbi:MAG: hypothetical protein PHQ22_10170 [Sulfuricurvum sp.]|nr:hypothetical protein [Sulfuricurvum sp.]MDD5387545.1 hypothetical protein [Sulfuricurvum sp.]